MPHIFNLFDCPIYVLYSFQKFEFKMIHRIIFACMIQCLPNISIVKVQSFGLQFSPFFIMLIEGNGHFVQELVVNTRLTITRTF